ncbi:hypothetical protein SUGI_0041460 [Cryptomeria japonica]|nr:hypothetical protein SUGI_0041460 [Cryptomeria japonica]
MGEVGKCWCGGLPAFWERSKPSLAMITLQTGLAVMNIISKIAVSHGMSPFVVLFYRQFFATIVTAPFAYILERKTRPKLTLGIFCEIFISSLFGITLNQNFYYRGLKYITATFAAGAFNLVPAITFLMAVILGCICFSAWFILQDNITNKYPAHIQLSIPVLL